MEIPGPTLDSFYSPTLDSLTRKLKDRQMTSIEDPCQKYKTKLMMTGECHND